MTYTIDAIFNGKVFEPSSQVNLKPNTKIKITIEEENRENLVFDNIHHQGIPKEIWLNNFYCPIKDFGGDFEVIEIEF
ncbi:papain fold toxin domain-containing protein [Cyanobacterium sp. DS4]|uniref:papain fold toxin domain-containing protein n=1 Tax=Cyanobacterium sp. DS4 TaxID=2878255 RepID=UPI002E81401E|nr:papain fold toxin domain-containing protein [Cyanobacterium sp. Dongsha4]WVK99858.1 DUF104 domain-containing protein [Cyanobacterium sp. Dongsha4]